MPFKITQNKKYFRRLFLLTGLLLSIFIAFYVGQITQSFKYKATFITCKQVDTLPSENFEEIKLSSSSSQLFRNIYDLSWDFSSILVEPNQDLETFLGEYSPAQSHYFLQNDQTLVHCSLVK